MTTPLDQLTAATDPKTLIAFEQAYTPVKYNTNGTCDRCGVNPSSTGRDTHAAWHKAQAKTTWILAANTLAAIQHGHLLLEKP